MAPSLAYVIPLQIQEINITGEAELLGPAPRLTNGRRPVPEANDAHDDVTPAKDLSLASGTQPVGDWSPSRQCEWNLCYARPDSSRFIQHSGRCVFVRLSTPPQQRGAGRNLINGTINIAVRCFKSIFGESIAAAGGMDGFR